MKKVKESSLLHLYFPSTIANCKSGFLIGNLSIEDSCDKEEEKLFSVTIIGIDSNSSSIFLSKPEANIKCVGAFDNPFQSYTSYIYNTKPFGPIWLTVSLSDSKSIVVERILSNDYQFSSVVIFEFDPQCLLNALRNPDSGIPNPIRESYYIELRHFSRPLKLKSLFPTEAETDSFEDPSEYDKISKTRVVLKKMREKMGNSLGLKQIFFKFSLLMKILNSFFDFEDYLKKFNLVSVLFVDMVLGALVTTYLLSFPNLLDLFTGKIEFFLEDLLKLLEWLQGSPAGLKLNSALNSLLGRFFSYHLHLWRSYIGLLQPVLSFLLGAAMHSGVMGLTIQIGFICDFINLATFHIYCLYIYATRLFNIELITLKALGRLFFGRKWNPLRNRVDSILLTKTEMFLSSLFFTIFVFLAPTTLVYYLVFLILRLPIVTIEWILKLSVEAFNHLDPVKRILILFNSSKFADEIYLEPVIFENQVEKFLIKTKTNRKLFQKPEIGHPLAQAFQKIISGKVLS